MKIVHLIVCAILISVCAEVVFGANKKTTALAKKTTAIAKKTATQKKMTSLKKTPTTKTATLKKRATPKKMVTSKKVVTLKKTVTPRKTATPIKPATTKKTVNPKKTATPDKNKKIGTRIIGGKTTTISTTKYLIYLRRDGRFTCGGTLVAPRKVVTAAHCVQGVRPSRLFVHGGTSYLTYEGQKRAVTRVVVSPNFNRRTMTYDVAVLTLARAMSGPNIAVIGLCTRTPKVGSTVKVYGWGLTNENRRRVSNQVRSVNVKVIRKSRCKRKYRFQAVISRTMMCATVPGGRKDACSGDSGGPLIYNGRLCGIISWGIGCARSAYPGVYTSIIEVKNFINRHL